MSTRRPRTASRVDGAGAVWDGVRVTRNPEREYAKAEAETRKTRPSTRTLRDAVRVLLEKSGSRFDHERLDQYQTSVRELEVMAERLRTAGEERGAEYLDCQALALLDKKICRRVIRQSRRTQRGSGDQLIPLIEGLA